MGADFTNQKSIMLEWDKWREYIANGGGGSWPRDAFESLLDYWEIPQDNKTVEQTASKSPSKTIIRYCRGCGRKMPGF